MSRDFRLGRASPLPIAVEINSIGRCYLDFNIGERKKKEREWDGEKFGIIQTLLSLGNVRWNASDNVRNVKIE